MDADRLRVEAGRQQHWRGKVADGIFDLGIEDLPWLLGGRGGADGERREGQHRKHGAEGKNAHGQE